MMAQRIDAQKDIQKLIRVISLCLYDGMAVILSVFAALILRFDLSIRAIDSRYIENGCRIVPVIVVLTWFIFKEFHLYNSLWEYASIREILQTIMACGIVTILQILIVIFTDPYYMPRSYYIIFGIIFIILTVLGRLSYRLMRIFRHNLDVMQYRETKRILLYGAGSAGRLILDEVNHANEMMEGHVCCILDDDKEKWGKYIRGVKITGGRQKIETAVKKYKIDQIIIAMPSISRKEQKEILDICKNTGCELKILPGIYQMINGDVSVSKLRNVEIQDLLGREQIKVNNEEILKDIGGKVILVTGGGGSIGSELCRQIAGANPRKLIIFDVYENNAYSIQQELRKIYPDIDMEVLIGSVRNTNRINWIMNTYHPDIVFHAAAHKHVPLMEDSPNEAIKNNVMGTYKTAKAAATTGVSKFVLISTDKAVNPTNIMGASKRLCEMVVQMMNRQEEKTDYVAVRFGNVLGSNGSVIPLFKKQIAEGGPVTVTDKRIIRYFMTIPEAVSLVLQASYYAKGGEIFVLDMGEPVKIDDMARNLIRLSGLVPDVDIKIEYTGLRPGEKLYEELLMDEEGLRETENSLIHIGNPIEMDDEWFRKKLKELDKASTQEIDRMKEIVAEIVPTYHPDNIVCDR